MASPRQLRANRANAQKSTGPVTKAGKLRSAMNGITHGLTVKNHLVLPGEDPARFQLQADAMLQEWEPETEAERLCVAQMTAAQWRLARSWQTEGALHTIVLAEQESTLDQISQDPDLYYAQAFRTLSQPGGSFNPMLRYQAHLERSYDRALERLRQLQKVRRAHFGNSEANPKIGHLLTAGEAN